MPVKTLFPRLLVACLALCLFTLSAFAQTDTRPRQVAKGLDADGTNRLENEVYLISEAPAERVDLLKTPLSTPTLLRFNQMMLSAIDGRLGAPYVYGATGPRVYDCSGFVWSVFREAGISFERGSARTFWAQFDVPKPGDEYKFGTLVFFNNLKHVGIVADEHGFYHASSSHGVTYSTFNDYWSERIVGFRRVPMPTQLLAE
ncbi:MAG TPA: C40 family peptidase [Pyrinomonadaceae bacterium]|nr:C40 family peptidase [Pyrinomonadaceae bacterium]